jgi:predicted DCC family thiol-disulfide oxidoreductase YuxK
MILSDSELTYLFYDGKCNFCNRSKKYLEERVLDPKVRYLSYHDFSDEKLAEFHPSLNSELCSGSIQYIVGNTRYPGFFAIRKISHRMKGFRWFSWALYLPLIPFFGIFGYVIIKKYRSKL